MEQSSLLKLRDLKGEAISLRQRKRGEGTEMSHAQALESVARKHGFRDWNTLRAFVKAQSHRSELAPGQFVEGTYLGQAFRGEIRAVQLMGQGHKRISIHFDQPVDVVQSPHFSSWRQRITATICTDGVSPARCSDGTPHLALLGL